MAEYANYHVGQKLLLRKGTEYLFLTPAGYTFLDLPGGRIDSHEDSLPLTDILDREIKEELGNIEYKCGPIAFQYRRTIPQKNVRVFLTVFEAEFITGTITLSSEAAQYQWVDPKINPLSRDQFSSDEEYSAFINYFSKKE